MSPKNAAILQAASAFRAAPARPAALLDTGRIARAFSRPFTDTLRDPYPLGRNNWLHFDRCTSPQIETLLGLMGMLHAYDPHTSQHSMQVENLAARLSTMLGVGEEEQHVIRVAAVLHDIGKIAVPINILAKPARLTAEEFEIVKKHPVVGAKIIEPIAFLKPVVPLVLHHHEWFNGAGYQSGLSGEAIPFGARILQTADCVDAMMSPRSYKQGYCIEKVVSELQLGRGSQFDPQVADAAINLLREIPQRCMS